MSSHDFELSNLDRPVVKILPEHRAYWIGQTLTMTAMSRPAAHRYAWLDLATGRWRNGSHFVISHSMAGVNNYTCVAFNRIFGVEYNSTIAFNFTADRRRYTWQEWAVSCYDGTIKTVIVVVKYTQLTCILTCTHVRVYYIRTYTLLTRF